MASSKSYFTVFYSNTKLFFVNYSCRPTPSLYCEACDAKFASKYRYERHLLTSKHKTLSELVAGHNSGSVPEQDEVDSDSEPPVPMDYEEVGEYLFLVERTRG